MPGTVKRIVCLANSRKPDGRCVAGKEFDGTTVGPWVRPVSARPGGEVSEHERHYQDGSDPRVMDIVDVPLLSHSPKTYQQENWLLDPGLYWEKRGTQSVPKLATFEDKPASLWVNGHSTFNGNNDYVPLPTAITLTTSLYLIRVSSVVLNVFAPSAKFGNPKRRVQGQFQYNGVSYWLWVTDPIIERKYLAMQDGTYNVGPSFLTISLGEPFNDQCYKLIATIIAAT